MFSHFEWKRPSASVFVLNFFPSSSTCPVYFRYVSSDSV